MSSEPAERIGGFQVIRRLATGQTSEILLARADGPFGFERPVVLKRLLPNYRDDPAFGRMFAREATAYARLTHPAIVKLYDFFAGDGQLVMVLEYVDGLSLDRLISMLANTGAPPRRPSGALRRLAHLHRAGRGARGHRSGDRGAGAGGSS